MVRPARPDPAHAIDGGLGGPEQAATLSTEAESFGIEAIETRVHGIDRSLLLLRRAG